MNVAFFIYRRPELTARVFAEIRKARPERLLIVADGPKNDEERPKCAATRAVVENVDWPCEVLKNYADVNLGCRKCVSSGLGWVFAHVEEAIILEDDCLPHPSFFRYCAELLDRYRNDERVMHISGDYFMKRLHPTPFSYYFSRCPYIWGWATWRRAWRHYDVEMRLWPQFRDSGLMANLWQSKDQQRHWTAVCDLAHSGEVDT